MGKHNKRFNFSITSEEKGKRWVCLLLSIYTFSVLSKKTLLWWIMVVMGGKAKVNPIKMNAVRIPEDSRHIPWIPRPIPLFIYLFISFFNWVWIQYESDLESIAWLMCLCFLGLPQIILAPNFLSIFLFKKN